MSIGTDGAQIRQDIIDAHDLFFQSFINWRMGFATLESTREDWYRLHRAMAVGLNFGTDEDREVWVQTDLKDNFQVQRGWVDVAQLPLSEAEKWVATRPDVRRIKP